MGSGTTAVAAKFLGHKWIGSDLSPNYIKMANDRIKNGWERDKVNFNEEVKKHFTKSKKENIKNINDIEELFD